jgi:nucleotide-binding universal stress UspA family protein
VRAQCTRVLGDDSCFAAACEGEATRVITRAATEHDAQLVVMGIGRHQLVDRVFGSETALKTSRSSRVPVLAVPSRASGALGRVVVAVDFSVHSLRAAEVALRLADDGALFQLVHVVPRERLLADAWISREEYDELVQHQFTRFAGQLEPPRGIDIELLTLGGDPAATLLDFASRQKTDLIAVGSHGHGAFSRFILGSVTTRVLRGALCSVLVVPPEP